MLDNLNKADERQDKLGELEDRADELLEKVSRKSSEKRFNEKYIITVAIFTWCGLWKSLG